MYYYAPASLVTSGRYCDIANTDTGKGPFRGSTKSLMIPLFLAVARLLPSSEEEFVVCSTVEYA